MAAIDMSDNPTIAYGTEAEPFDYSAGADLFPSRGRMSKRPIFKYQRFVRAADAIRFAIEELPEELLLGTYMEIDEARFDSRAIRRLYDSIEYPLARRAAA
jgi:hypothetical protein